MCVCLCDGICQTSQSQWLCKVLYCASAPAVNCFSVLTWFVTNCLKRVFMAVLWRPECSAVCRWQLTFHAAFSDCISLFLFYSWFLLYAAQFSGWAQIMHLSICASSIIQLWLSSVISPWLWQWIKPLPGDTCQAHCKACNNSSAGNDNNNSQRHI